MIKINLFNQDDYNRLLLKRVVDAYHAEREVKSFSQRHPELGRMVNCQVCNLRHRASRVCVPVYSTELGNLNEQGVRVLSTKKQKFGAAAFKGRIIKHRNAWGLQVLERATLIFRVRDDRRFTPAPGESFFDMSPEAQKSRKEYEESLGKQCLSRALNEKRAERAADRKVRMTRAKESQRINRA